MTSISQYTLPPHGLNKPDLSPASLDTSREHLMRTQAINDGERSSGPPRSLMNVFHCLDKVTDNTEQLAKLLDAPNAPAHQTLTEQLPAAMLLMRDAMANIKSSSALFDNDPELNTLKRNTPELADLLDKGHTLTSTEDKTNPWLSGMGLVEDYVAYYRTYETGTTRNTNFFSAFNEFLKVKSKYLDVRTDDKGNQFMYFKPGIEAELTALIEKYTKTEAGILFPVSGVASEAEAKSWAEEWGLDPTCVKPSGSGYVVRVDISPLQSILALFKEKIDEGGGKFKELNSIEYNAFDSAFNGLAEKLKNQVQIFMTKLSDTLGRVETWTKQVNTWIEQKKDLLMRLFS
ncbi:IpaD/SipD/SspD family type III secretion system needle tip protein [Sodalis sp. RH23]|uniref:IpaD/SipD/SspD family type III secretion system needle tip protein n=1 Tax=unclassified Sodalis (in: enterobacteria) TaxID=2636512 RepID=UPI0039B5ECF9